MIKSGLSAFRGRHILLLQGPVGPFFSRLARDLEWVGAIVTKIDFNGGDWLFSPAGSIAFRGRMEEWPVFFDQVLVSRQIDVVLLFGDCRPIHRVAYAIAIKRRLEIGVFEEGYIRPDYITLERFGVNGHSRIPNTPDFYVNMPPADIPPTRNVGKTFWYAVLWSILYYLASVLLRPLFHHYKHHRPLTLWEAWPWVRSCWRKFYFALKERGIQAELQSTFSGQFYLVPLQVYNDAQIHVHSDFETVEAFICHVISSFARFAPSDTLLVIKHHPRDRGYLDYTVMIQNFVKIHGVEKRVLYIHDLHLPTLLQHARGIVVVNSTVGLSALMRKKPTKVCGTAVYDIEGLTFQGALDDFWISSQDYKITKDLFEHFRSYLIERTQVNGSFYRRLDVAQSNAGLVWPVFPVR
ncbi:MAG: capsular biosynthesis protein [Deltaproteobacteria bacterium RIFOXYD12_FULL_50_9]|nr:MAG: capsular biosynthesis protein [Deltaproteobacteria bacterium RIFOXYD12_FULL_50_9]